MIPETNPLQAHFSLDSRPPFRLMSHGTRLPSHKRDVSWYDDKVHQNHDNAARDDGIAEPNPWHSRGELTRMPAIARSRLSSLKR